VPPKRLAVAFAALALAGACSDDDGEPEAPPVTGATAGCPLPQAVVADAVGHPVSVERGDERGTCAYVTNDGAATGGRVEVSVQQLDDLSYADALADVERRTGRAENLDDRVDGSERGWLVTVGRAVQVGAADDERLVVVAVTDPLLDADAARQVAIDLAGEALTA
jgi:hypothetical protein